jgi:hypothetical protein
LRLKSLRRGSSGEASQLQAEAFALKNEDFQHAGYERPSIQAYLERTVRNMARYY